jgi:hypothetical protein
MRYMLVNVSEGNLPVDLHRPDKPQQWIKMRRLGPDVAISLPRGESIDILPHFGGSLEKAHAAVMHSRDVMKLLNPNQLHIYVCDDTGKRIDIDKLFSVEGSEKPVEAAKPAPSTPVSGDPTQPNIELVEAIARQDQFEAKKRGEANPPPKSYVRYTYNDLKKLNSKDLITLAKRYFNMTLDPKSTKKAMIETILGAQKSV